MNLADICKKAQEGFERMNKSPVVGIVGVFKTDEGWLLSLEALERKAIPETMDLLGLYEIRLDAEGNLFGFKRKRLRKRGETKED